MIDTGNLVAGIPAGRPSEQDQAACNGFTANAICSGTIISVDYDVQQWADAAEAYGKSLRGERFEAAPSRFIASHKLSHLEPTRMEIGKGRRKCMLVCCCKSGQNTVMEADNRL
jgi:hypothetical protein